jgi:hypothetical protein
VKCLSFEAIVADKSLGFGDIEPTPEAIRRAIDAQLREMQSQSLDGTLIATARWSTLDASSKNSKARGRRPEEGNSYQSQLRFSNA